MKPDIIFITETWLNESIFDCEILPYGYNIVRSLERSTAARGRDLLIALNNSICFQRITGPDCLEMIDIIAVECVLPNSIEIFYYLFVIVSLTTPISTYG